MSLKALSEYTFASRYARYDFKLKRRETWHEAIERVKKMHLYKYPMVADEINWAFEHVHNKIALGSQRALQFGGDPILKRNAKIYNCISSYCDRPRFFQECMWLLLNGCGTGFSVQLHHVDKLPNFHISKSTDLSEEKIYKIDDSIEGWSDAVGALIASYMPHPEFSEYYGKKVKFDYSAIRPKGASLSYGVGKAPGHEPLQKALEEIRNLINKTIDSGNKKLRTIDAYDIIMHSSDAVLSGGVRRSATLAMFSPQDELMLNAKIGNWYYENPQRGRSNNSALLLKNSTGRDEYHKLFESTRQFGEPGIIWSHSTESLYNPCVTEDTIIATKDGINIVSELIGKQFDALVDGKAYLSTEKGFWKTGNKEVIKLVFASGRELKCTPNHQILTVNGWKEAKDITSEDEVIINNHSEFNDKNIDVYSSDYAKGYLLGSLLADGNLLNNTSAQLKWWGENKHDYQKEGYELLEQAEFLSNYHGCNSKEVLVNEYVSIQSRKLFDFAKEKECITEDFKKELSKKAICGSWSYLSGLIAGYFDADGTVAVNTEKGNSIRITSNQYDNLVNLQIALNGLGILSKIYKYRRHEGWHKLPDGNGGSKEYFTQAVHEISISGNGIEMFYKNIKIKNKNKLEKIKQIVTSRKRMPNRSIYLDNVIAKQDMGKENVYDCTVPEVHAFDANSVYVHNCVEINLYGYDEQGNSGWQACNLSTINGSKLNSKENFALGAKVAAIIGTLQAGYTDFAYLGPISESIIRREALLGVSMTGIMDYPSITLNKDNLREMAQVVLQTNEDIANKIGINIASRTTCVKPEGTASCLLGTSSGIHPAHAKRYIRRVQSNAMEIPIQHFKLYNPAAIEKSVWSANGTDEVISFLIEMPEGVITKENMSAVQLLETVKLVQENWVEAGKRPEKCVQPWLSHNVSNTINVKDEEWPAVEEFIYNNRESFAGISLLSATGDLDYPQAPFSKVLTAEELVKKYGQGVLFSSGLIVDGLHAFNDNLWKACDSLLGIYSLEKPQDPDKISDDNIEKYQHDIKIYFLQKDWMRRAKQFAERYLKGDMKELTYLLKDVNNNKLWQDLNRIYVNVNWDEMYEAEDNTQLIENIACGNGACSKNSL